MANIVITTRCNLRCPYCFANEFVNQGADGNISLENFQKILDFILLDGNEKTVGLIGGEPTIHPDFGKIIAILNQEKRLERVTVYTNGTEILPFIGRFSDKFAFLINCNSPEDTGELAWKKTRDAVFEMTKTELSEHMSLGVNYYRRNFDYSYLFPLLSLLPHPRLRVSLSIPNSRDKISRPMNYFREMKDELFSFFDALRERGVIPYFDCNFFPPCLIKMDDLARFDQWGAESPLSKMKNRPAICQPVIDIMGDFTAVRCFGLSCYTREKITDFASLRDLRNYYLRTVDAFAVNAWHDAKCATCYKFLTAKCSAGCLIYKINKIQALKKAVTEFER